MIKIQTFVFNPLQVNTYLLFDETNECVIIDPSCNSGIEKNELTSYIERKQLKPVALLNTHGHFDHVFGNSLVCEKYNLTVSGHEADLFLVKESIQYARMFGLDAEKSPLTSKYLVENDIIPFGKTFLKTLHVPGHSPGSLVFYSEEGKFAITGDTLFLQSIGRTDLPGGDYNTLIENITGKLLSLPGDTKVYPGHGEPTTIGYEKSNNAFLR